MEIVNKITRIKVSMLVIDYDFYPRNEISSTNKADIKRAMLAGEVLPPVVVGFLSGTSDAVTDPAALRVVDGVHRVKDALEVYGPDYEIEAQVRKYDNVAEMFYDAMYLNSRHGQKLTPLDIRWVATLVADGVAPLAPTN